MMIAKRQHPLAARPVNTRMLAWFRAVHILGIAGVVYLAAIRCHPATVVSAITLFVLCHLSITAGLHRLYSHKSYRASPALEVFLLIFAAATFQSSAMIWIYFHRMHHAHSETDADPYSVQHGFWWAHYRWALYTPMRVVRRRAVRDLMGNRLLRLQHRHYRWLSLAAGIGLPAAVALLWGDFWGGLLVGGFLRVAVQYHTTWSINSVAHTFGFRRYTPTGTARWSPYLTFSTVGENSHERHHLAPEDYRLGVRWYDFDVGKWFIELCALLGLAHKLRTVPEEAVLIRTKRLAAPS